MRFAYPALCCIALCGAHAPAAAQLVGERIDQGRRVCVYHAEPTALTAGDRFVTVPAGAGLTCPASPPVARSQLAAPPSAMLLTQEATDTLRVCTYEQMGQRWSFSLPAAQTCPASAGSLAHLRRSD